MTFPRHFPPLPADPDGAGPTLLTDQLAWTRHEDGTVSRLAVRESSVWHTTWTTRHGFDSTALKGGGAPPPGTRVHPDDLPDRAPALLTGALALLGPVELLPGHLWESLTAAILSQDLATGQARDLYQRWAGAYGDTYTTAAGPMATAPRPAVVRHLSRGKFAALGVLDRRDALRAAAAAYQQDAAVWAVMTPHNLNGALGRIPGLSGGPAAIAAAHATGDYSLYPPDDPAVRAGAAAAASEDLPIPRDAAGFAASWRRWAPGHDQRHALTVYALAAAHRTESAFPGEITVPVPVTVAGTTAAGRLHA